MDVTDPLPPLPAAVEVAAYRIILEAFTNVIHHAEANACRITIVIREKDLFIEVADDGKGLLPGTRNGVGLTSMHERAEELGGVCVVEKGAAHGTTVWARLPIRKD
jgi:two-component system NarL family sensor kinase